VIRRAEVTDAGPLLGLMRQLAQFEGYDEYFAVTEADLIARGLGRCEDAQFVAWVAEGDGVLQGYAVAYLVPFTFDLRPTVVLKELFVSGDSRGRRVGEQLFAEVLLYGKARGARLLRWQVLPTNEAAQRFYGRLGGEHETAWQSWMLELTR